MSSFRARARRLAFRDSNENLSDASSGHSSHRSRRSVGSEGISRNTSDLSEQSISSSREKAAYIPPKRTSKVRRINHNQPFELFVEALEHDGCVIVEDFVNPQISQRVHKAEEADMGPMGEDAEPWATAVDVNGLIRESLVSDSLYQTLTSHFLTLETLSWQNKQIEMNANRPIVSASETFDLNCMYLSSKEEPMAFHRADRVHHVRHSATNKYDYQSRRDVSLGLFVPEVDSLSASMSVKTVPGSHLWDDQKPDLVKGVKDVEIRGGEALILLGSLYHRVESPAFKNPAADRKDSGTTKEQLVHELWMCSGIYRPASELEDDD